ncbi:xaa-Pro aminopeptidase-like protein [Lindgomyces ingoldianus]|uniref:Xaa-Pro aminopeptidase-like protein n=1 Tax=Lindgomyces ingoldianus TaxID=673940 RepID=A0ACB6QQB8_9PLEO|nr:xaa-Pro aminopeptidase-like protein [Lindgomyces ingoldianus]KAF2468477.1 xaa-Pro aminopeptidase-like protein [Lindgomyces ingoldianus]
MTVGLRTLRPVLRVGGRGVNPTCWMGRKQLSVSAAELRFGQPLHETHPHLLKAGEVTPGITAQEYYNRRANLAHALPPNSIAILAASDLKYRSGAVFYKFHQDPDFLYLTGFNEPDALAVIEKTSNDSEHTFHLYVRPKDLKAELWEGARSGVQAAQDVFNADSAGNVNNLPKLLPEILQRAKTVYTDLPNSIITKNILARYLSGMEPARSGGVAQALRDASGSGIAIKSLRPFMNDLRVMKSPAEIANMRHAGQVSGRAITDAMRQSFSSEKDLDSYLDYRFKQHGCDGPAYVPVIAGGINANTIHYVSNDQLFKSGDLVLVDAGAEYGGYITDISRTWPTNGKFGDAQRDLYSLLLSVQRTCVSLCRANSGFNLDKLHKTASSSLAGGLKDLGFDMSDDAIDILFPHHVGHYIGLDVHDSPGFPRNRQFEKGMCVTVEPGIYVPDDERWPVWARGIGIRIEDSVCVDDDSPLVLTTEAVKEVVDIEALRD